MYHKIKFLTFLFLISLYSFSQEGITVYSDYLSDNYYLLHPSMAGAASCDKVRLTARKQWLDQSESPQLNTLSYNGQLSERSGAGIILFNDKNGYHSQKGLKLSYAYHLMFSRDEIDLNQLSFGINTNFMQSQLDETEFLASGDFDPIVDGTIVQKDSYINFDIGTSYNYMDFYLHATVKNIVETRRDIYTEYESDNLRKFLLSSGYVFGDSEQILWEPSILFQFVDKTQESSIDVNIKAYKSLNFGKLWGALSYRRSFDGADYTDGSGTSSQKLNYITPIIGINYGKYMFAYTYTYLVGPINYETAGFHQITLGVDLFCKREKYDCNCPALN